MSGALLRHRPVIVTTGAYHAATVPCWMPSGGRAVIPYGIAAPFRTSRAAARATAAARDLHLEPAARARLAARSVGARASIRRCRRRSFISIAAPRSMAASARRRPRPMAAVLARADAARGERRAPPRAAAARRADRRAARRARDALSRRCRRDLLPGRRRGAGAGRAGGGADSGRAGRARHRRRDRVRSPRDDDSFARAAIALLGDDALWRRQHEAALARQKGSSWDEVAQRFEALAA